jgi:alkylation response protein AidB-like acyl-CoA dehydrogenase
MFHLNYLREHGLIEFGRDTAGFAIKPEVVRITARGIDFLAEDGGPSAILNATTVKFDVENVRKLVEAGLLRANVPEEKQGALKKAIKEAPGTVLQTAVSKMVEKGISDPVGTAKAVAGLFGISW